MTDTADLISFNAKICSTAGAALIVNDQILLIRHKKLGVWLCPGGHVEKNEFAFQTAERECLEETGIKVQAINPYPLIKTTKEQLIVVPVISSLHWISKQNYQARIASQNLNKLHKTLLWPRGCEQHLGSIYLVKPLEHIQPKLNPAEATGIDWFNLPQIDSLKTSDDTKSELRLVLTLFPGLSTK